ncbi:MAG: type II toxin-antitoxin system Phd/YefM family antitoxin [Verrucomicrobiia bacterium]|tara:strand:- start:470 stop:712 length:243 start_codon:yes stop_codon:yes gene_type:complete
MTTITATSARNKLYSLIDEANDSHIPIQITGKRGNAVLVSEDDWKAISETIHLSSIPGMVDSIKTGMNEKIEACSESIEW